MRRAIATFLSTIVIILTGCATKPPETITVEKPVQIPGPITYIPVPAALFVGCVSPVPAGPTNGDLLQHDHAVAVYAACLEGELASIKGLK